MKRVIIEITADPDVFFEIRYIRPDETEAKYDPSGLIEMACFLNNITPGALQSKSRHQKMVDARRMIAAYLRFEKDFTYMGIAQMLGYKEHSTVLYLCSTHSDFMRYDDYATKYNKLLQI